VVLIRRRRESFFESASHFELLSKRHFIQRKSPGTKEKLEKGFRITKVAEFYEQIIFGNKIMFEANASPRYRSLKTDGNTFVIK